MTKLTIQSVVEIPLWDLQTPHGRKAFSSGANVCAICGKPIKEGAKVKYIHFLTNGNIVSSFEDMDNSQGCFPIGLECAKKLVIDFTTTLS